MRSVRERIRIDDKALSEEEFARLFFQLWRQVENAKSQDPELPIINYFRFLTLLAFYTFLQRRVYVAVIETGVGGEYDSTNVIAKPIVAAITTLDFDHIQTLGHHLTDIAWHKAGIFKRGVPAVSVEQPKEATDVLRARAKEKGIDLIISPDQRLPLSLFAHAALRQNANLAIGLAQIAARQLQKPPPTASDAMAVLKDMRWPGRLHQVTRGEYHWFLDGAHSPKAYRLLLSGLPNKREGITFYRNYICSSLIIYSIPQQRRALVFCAPSQRDAASLTTQCLCESPGG